MKRLRTKKRRTLTPKQKQNRLERLHISTAIKDELLIGLDREIRGFRDIRWLVKSKKFNTIKDVKYNLLHIILNEYNGHIKKHKTDDEYSSYHSVKNREILGADSDKLIDLVFDKKHPGGQYNLVNDNTTLKYKLKQKVIDICDRVYLGEYKLHARIGRDGKNLITIPEYVVRNVEDGGVKKTNTTDKYNFDNVVQLNEDNMLLMIKMFAELYRNKMGKKNDIRHWEGILGSVGKDWKGYSIIQLEDRIKKAIELINKASVDILGEGRVLQVYTEKESGRLFGDEWLNLQNLPKEMRYIAMGGQNYYEYDIENAHYNFLYQLNIMYGGIPIDNIGAYIKDTEGTRTAIATQTGIDYGVIKIILLSMIYGASLRQTHTYNADTYSSYDNAILTTLKDYADGNRDEAVHLFSLVKENPLMAGINEDLQRAKETFKKNFIYKTIDKKKHILNPYQKATPILDEKGDEKSLGKLMAHMIQGVEAAILVFVMEEEQKEFIMPHHDGWVSLIDWETTTLERIVMAKTSRMMMDYKGIAKGFNIKITKKKINDISKGKWADEILLAKSVKELVGKEYKPY
jgi:hypothetical protein